MIEQTIAVGAASVEFDVAVGTPMAGYIARERPAAGTHDPVTVRALVLAGTYAIVAVDVCVLHEETCTVIRQEARDVGLEDVVVCATHTHSGPSVGCGRVGVHDERAHAAMLRAAGEAIRQALMSAEPCSAELVEQYDLAIAYDRRHGHTIDVPIRAIRFINAGDSVVAVWANFACHPVVLDATNILVSADYPGYLRASLESRYVGATCLFTTGAAGEVNSGHHASDSLRPSGGASRSFERAREIGDVLAAAAARPGRSVRLPHVRLISEAVELRYEHDSVSTHGPTHWRGRVSVLSLGTATVVFLPGEPFNEWAEPLLQQIPTTWGFVTGYADGVPGYLPSRAAFDEGGYEVDAAHRYYGAPGAFASDCSLVASQAVERALERISEMEV